MLPKAYTKHLHKNKPCLSFSEQYALLENACREYVFLSEFFMVQGTAADELFHQVMDKSLVLLQGNMEDYVNSSYDCIALFLCAHLTVRFRDMCRNKGRSTQWCPEIILNKIEKTFNKTYTGLIELGQFGTAA